jgi:hypothetical protein
MSCVEGQTRQWPEIKRTDRQTMVDKTLQLQLEIEQHEHHSQTGVK